jgi:hypothetical protein
MSVSYWFEIILESVGIGIFPDKSEFTRSGGVDAVPKKTPLCPSLSDLSRLQRLQIAARFSGSYSAPPLDRGRIWSTSFASGVPHR